ncbi:uncharacterized protein K460DRAFT_411531 [Cucurbitaria berberidis CBS 394.84]|uniref:DUF862-domain-containing protein n=1 Tax=Cucurbitaria berberidis CBS 394.84 TaxID=1168544 RepID=A0A9P4GQY3_9PLEO|nr:uncharacterized protein K460DRAFT_411531 [Cucurbitaria berberidis CBS 394.84]KAF1849700.1 hypothetical protein K460DRAFT_411531 [Cucurbitaria berberidis CBS 394.84]
MKFQTPLLLLASLLSYVSAEAFDAGPALEARSHPRDFVAEIQDFDLSKRAAPPVPSGKDATKLHVWIRTDERPITYDDRSGAKHEGLNQLIKDTGGRHKDVVVGNSKGYFEYGLQFNDKSWQTKPNGDGAPVSEYDGDYIEVKGGHESYEYKGQVKDGRKTLKSIATMAETEIKGKTYNHVSYNCATFATNLAKQLV